MYSCRLCGCSIPEKRSIPIRMRFNISNIGFNGLPDICWEICDTHLEKLNMWYRRKRSFAVKGHITNDIIIEWVANEIRLLANRMKKGLPGGYCECMTHEGRHRCTRWADGYIGDIKACGGHLKQHDDGRKVFMLKGKEQPIKAAVNLLLGNL